MARSVTAACEVSAGDVWLCVQGQDVYLDPAGVPDGEPVVQITWDTPENGVYLTLRDIDRLAALAVELRRQMGA